MCGARREDRGRDDEEDAHYTNIGCWYSRCTSAGHASSLDSQHDAKPSKLTGRSVVTRKCADWEESVMKEQEPNPASAKEQAEGSRENVNVDFPAPKETGSNKK